ncbi:MAG: pentapeptide repeat-containing protein, partial [Hyphomicrobiales bacterium]
RTVFTGARLAGASFKRAFLSWARFEGADLGAAKDIAQAQLDLACGDQNTKLPAGLTAPKTWPCAPD